MGVADIHAGPTDVLLLDLFLQPLDRLAGIPHYGVLHLDFHHQVAAALEVQTQADVLLQVVDQFRLGRGNTGDPEDTHQDRHNNNHRSRRQILSHGS